MSDLSKKLQKNADDLAAKTTVRRSSLDTKLHFVAFQIGNLNILEKYFGNLVSFKITETEKQNISALIEQSVEQYEDQARRIVGRDKIIDPEEKRDGEYVIKDATERRKKTKELEKTWNKIVQENIDKSIASFKDLYEALAAFIKKKHKYKIIITSSGEWKDFNTNETIPPSSLINFTPATVYNINKSDTNIIGALYRSYDSAGRGLFTPFFNQVLSKKVIEYSETYKKTVQDVYGKDLSKEVFGIDIGHLIGVSDYVTSVLQQKLIDAVTELKNKVLLDNSSNSIIQSKINDIINLEQELISKSRFGSEIEEAVKLEVNINNAFSKADILIVIPQLRFQNQYEYGSLVELPIGRALPKIVESVLEGKSSPSYIDVIGIKLFEVIKYGTIKTKFVTKPVKVVSKQKNSNKTNIVKEKYKTTINSVKLTKLNIPKPKKPKINLTTNLTSLQRLLDAQLVQTVKQNMGTGNRRDVLNLRTGRFAESVKVERLSESREGMITAFYSYMKNPYATFSAGGRQETPKTRDPKLLIAKSIREVAAQLVTNRLRSVNV
jgi:hypothetical protein